MNTLTASMLKVLFSIVLLAIAFWPGYGLSFYIGEHFMEKPELFSVLIALWVAAFALNLPLSLNMFRKITTGSIVAIFGVVIFTLMEAGYFAPGDLNAWLITAIFILGLVIGWWTVSVRLWRWYRSVTPTDETNSETL